MGCCSTSVGALSILVIATAHPRSHSRTVQLDRRLTMMRFFLISSTHLSKLNRLCRGQALSSIVRYGLVDNGATIEAFPRIKHQKEIGESLQAHQPLAFGTFHRAPPLGEKLRLAGAIFGPRGSPPGKSKTLEINPSKNGRNRCRYVQ